MVFAYTAIKYEIWTDHSAGLDRAQKYKIQIELGSTYHLFGEFIINWMVKGKIIEIYVEYLLP